VAQRAWAGCATLLSIAFFPSCGRYAPLFKQKFL
jgi:hypothetical protein